LIARKVWREKAVAVYVAMGLGKTRSVLEAVAAREAWPALVICPKSVMGVWRAETQKWLGFEPVLVAGTKAKRDKLLAQPTKLYVISYGSLRTYNKRRMVPNPETGRKHRITENALRAVQPWETVILDEASAIKHGNTHQSHACHAFGDVPRRYILTGTPITHSPLDLWSQFKFLVPKLFPSWMEFEVHYTTSFQQRLPVGHSSRHTHFRRVTGYRNLDALWEAVRPYTIQLKAEDCLKLPERIRQTQRIPLSAAQRRAYDDLVEEYITELNEFDVVTAANVLARMNKLQQICQGWVLTEDKSLIRFPENPKLEALSDRLEVIAASDKAIVFSFFREDIAAVERVCEKLKIGYVTIHGDTSLAQRQQAEKNLHNDPQVRVLNGQIQAAGYGLNLQAAHYTLYYSGDFNPDVRIQSEARNYRIGSTKPVVIIDFVCEDSVDELLIENRNMKYEFAQSFDADRFRTWCKGKIE
jgi:SNF2 family DNA or RNA helicase